MRKTRYLLQEVVRQNKHIIYYALDLSEQSLKNCLDAMIKEFPTVDVRGLWGTYEDSLEYIQKAFPPETQKMFLWLGSSIGNMTRPDAAQFLHSVTEKGMTLGDFFLCGIDRRKASSIIKLAYDDPHKITEAFIMNGLNHVNQIFGSEAFNVSHFEYISIYNAVLGRHEAYYRCLKDYSLTLGSFPTLHFKQGELINIEYSYKYSKAEVDQLVHDAHFYHVDQWTDAQSYYDLHLFQKTPFHFNRSKQETSYPTLQEWEQLWNAW
jgi:EasF-like predicted methyltransferase